MRVKQSIAPSKSSKPQQGWKELMGGRRAGGTDKGVSQPDPRSQSCACELRCGKERGTPLLHK